MVRTFNPDVSDRTLMYKAAGVIEEDAQALRRSHTLDGKWVQLDDLDRAAKALYDEHMRIVAELRARARYAE